MNLGPVAWADWCEDFVFCVMKKAPEYVRWMDTSGNKDKRKSLDKTAHFSTCGKRAPGFPRFIEDMFLEHMR